MEEQEEKTCPCCHKKKVRSEEEYTKLIHRLNRIEGQIRGIRAFNRELLSQHIRTCVAQDIREGHDEVIEELVTTLQKLMK